MLCCFAETLTTHRDLSSTMCSPTGYETFLSLFHAIEQGFQPFRKNLLLLTNFFLEFLLHFGGEFFKQRVELFLFIL